MKKSKKKSLSQTGRLSKKNKTKKIASKQRNCRKKTIISPVQEKVAKKIDPAKMYFTTATEDAIVMYNQETDFAKKNAIYEERIRHPFEKLVENVFNTFKFTYFDVAPLRTQQETVSHLVVNLHKYEKHKGKAFSYFSIIAKNHLIFNNNLNFKRYNMHVDIGEENEEGTVVLQCKDKHHKEAEDKEFLRLMVKYWDENIKSIFKKDRDLSIAQAVIELFRNSDKIDVFNKKALYLYIREISSCHTQQITKVINKMKSYQSQIRRSYIENGII